MKKSMQIVTSLSAAVILALASACTKQKPPEPAKEIRSTFIGLWEGKTKKGEVFTISFTSDTEWVSNKESEGISIPYYRGTYSQTGLRLDLLITQEWNLRTEAWVPQKGNLGPNMVGRLAGGKLNIAALTDAELAKRR